MHTFMVTLASVAVFCLSTLADNHLRPDDTHDFFALHLDSSTSPESIAQLLGAHHEGPIGELPGHHKFSLSKENSTGVDTLLQTLRAQRKKLRRGVGRHHERDDQDGLDGILWSQKLALKKMLQKRESPPLEHLDTSQWVEDPMAVRTQQNIMLALGITDPLFSKQWHLFNTIQLGEDMNVTGLWMEGVTGHGIVTAIIDDGLDMHSVDLQGNYFPQGSYNFNDKTNNPQPRLLSDTHGTRCAGEVAAGKNSLCGIGMVYEGKVAGIRLLSGPIDESDEAAALNYKFHENHIYSCSWGPPDNGDAMGAPGVLVQRALVNGVQNGRRGKGSIFIFAAGNGGFLGDNCNFDGYTNSIYSVTVGALNREGDHAEYSEPCAAQLVVAYSSGGYKSDGADAIYTTDLGASSCTAAHGGTSAAGPLVAGAVALALSVRPELTWRDVQYLVQDTAMPIHENDNGSDWQVTMSGKKFSHTYGFGKIDTYALVHGAMEWSLVKPQAWYHSPWMHLNKEIPQGLEGVTSTVEITREIIQAANIARLEHVTVTMNVDHNRRGDLSVELHGPEGMVSYLSTPRTYDNEKAGYVDWTFMSVAHWGESGIGTWTVIVKDTQINNFTGIFGSWSLNLWGEAIDADSQSLHPLPGTTDEEDVILDSAVETLQPPSFPSVIPVASVSPSSPSSNKLPPSSFPTLMRIWVYAVLSLVISLSVAIGACIHFEGRKILIREHYEFEVGKNYDEALDDQRYRDNCAPAVETDEDDANLLDKSNEIV